GRRVCDVDRVECRIVRSLLRHARAARRSTGRRGNIPLGYYKDPERTAATFPTIDGVRWSVPGDYASLQPDGTIRLLGRGTTSINTAGEKVWPEEVEGVIKSLPGVVDVAVVGVPDARFGERVVA